MTQENTINGLKAQTTAAASTPEAKKADSSQAATSATTQQMGQTEFLTLLVNQLQHQDPLNPMESEEFAVQLAQFSQLEQLIQINKKLSGESGAPGSVQTMAAYLGNEVVLKDAGFTVTDGKGSNLLVDVPEGTSGLRVDFVDAGGAVVGSRTVEDFEAGQQVLRFDDLTVPDGSYDVRVVSVNAGGYFAELEAKVTGTVEGFVVEPEPMLLIGGKEVALEDVVEVHLGSNA
ncbi:MAG TPA: flagellar hook capping FlgD N-terminal domain-containing protein [Oligoflexia bacterium]|nr:flagellar hook capping FlgD N-terminal domain-containing protein [Oligoflexia bacterium]